MPLIHFGIPGMHWGVRRYRLKSGALTEEGKERYNKKTDREARKDAEKYVVAKQYYGEGAGTRRKLLKGELSKKMKDPEYAERFDYYVKNADMVRATKKAKGERRRTDTAESARKTFKKIMKAVSLIGVPAATIAGSYWYSKHSNEINRYMQRTVDQLDKKAKRFERDIHRKFK